MRDDDTAGRHHVLNHAQAERKAKVEPYCVRNELGRESGGDDKRIMSNFLTSSMYAHSSSAVS